MEAREIDVNAPNRWRLDTPGVEGWPRTARPTDPDKLFVVSADGHVNEPSDLFYDRMPERFKSFPNKLVT